MRNPENRSRDLPPVRRKGLPVPSAPAGPFLPFEKNLPRRRCVRPGAMARNRDTGFKGSKSLKEQPPEGSAGRSRNRPPGSARGGAGEREEAHRGPWRDSPSSGRRTVTAVQTRREGGNHKGDSTRVSQEPWPKGRQWRFLRPGCLPRVGGILHEAWGRGSP